jgi:hypothetical protein
MDNRVDGLLKKRWGSQTSKVGIEIGTRKHYPIGLLGLAQGHRSSMTAASVQHKAARGCRNLRYPGDSHHNLRSNPPPLEQPCVTLGGAPVP